MSVIPIRMLQAPTVAEATTPHLRLVAPHDHEWQLRSVDYDDAFEVRRYECASCDEVLFR